MAGCVAARTGTSILTDLSVWRLDPDRAHETVEVLLEVGDPAYAIDNETAITVTDGNVEVVSEGHWRFFPP
jgi:hypothetical protein